MVLNEKQREFCRLYVKSGNASESYLLAGYAGKTPLHAARSASRLLKKVDVREYVEELSAKFDEEAVAGAEETMRFLTSVMRGDVIETKALATKVGVEIVEIPSDTPSRVKAAQEIMKRHPLADGLIKFEPRIIIGEYKGGDDDD